MLIINQASECGRRVTVVGDGIWQLRQEHARVKQAAQDQYRGLGIGLNVGTWLGGAGGC